uniref:Homologous-pairing protein 2 winged helix domain-containing protein n=1 Tax=Catharus ustulatus TaxID=91951 RepID=A0A8C3V1Q9_CATUS
AAVTGAGPAGGAANRPYSAQDAFGNLQREHGLSKAAVVKALEQLAQQGRIREKVYGKQKIYFADQLLCLNPGPVWVQDPALPLQALLARGSWQPCSGL